MDRDTFRTVVKGFITHEGRVLIGRKESKQGHPISGEWHFLGGHLAAGESVEAAMRREVREETGLEVTVAELIDVMTFAWGDGDTRESLQILYHCTAETADAAPRDDLQAVEWVAPDELADRLHEEEADRLTTRPRQSSFLEAFGST